MAEKFRQWEADRKSGPSPFPGARYVLLHSLAHALIRQLSLDCGYPASSVRERIYSSMDPKKPMAGVLLYTASADSEGGLGDWLILETPSDSLISSVAHSGRSCIALPIPCVLIINLMSTPRLMAQLVTPAFSRQRHLVSHSIDFSIVTFWSQQ